MRRTRRTVLTLLLATVLAAPAGAAEERLARAQALLDDGRPAAALEALAPLLRRDPDDAEALLLRSTARFMEGSTEEGRADLERVLEIAPDLRQAWLNRAGLDVAEEHYDRALEALERARDLDPSALDNHLNLGAVLLLQGRLPEATEHFRSYLDAAGGSAEAHYLVATNYAGRGYARLAVENLRSAVEADEGFRLRARTDPNFQAIAEAPELRELFETDLHPPGKDDRVTRRSYPVAYAQGEGPLLSAVLEALRRAGEPFDPRVEVTPRWALVHGELRVKVYDQPGADGGTEGVVTISAPSEDFTREEWGERVDRLLEAVEVGLLRRSRSEPPDPGAATAGRPSGRPSDDLDWRRYS